MNRQLYALLAGFALVLSAQAGLCDSELSSESPDRMNSQVYEDTEGGGNSLEGTEIANVLIQVPMVVAQLKQEKMRVDSVTMVPFDSSRLRWKYDFYLVEDCSRCRPRKGHLMVFKEVRPGDQKTPGVELYSHLLRINPK